MLKTDTKQFRISGDYRDFKITKMSGMRSDYVCKLVELVLILPMRARYSFNKIKTLTTVKNSVLLYIL